MSMTEEKIDKPGQAALRNMEIIRSETSMFKIPCKAPKKRGSKKKASVLDEDIYVEGIAKIIQRDFFPDLAKLKVQNEYLEATENKDYSRLREITQKYSGNRIRPATEPYNTPATFETPEHSRMDDIDATPSDTIRGQRPTSSEAPQKPKDVTDNHSLDSFLSSHTSEDNASYERVISLEDKKRAGKFSSQFEAERTSSQLAIEAVQLPSIEAQADHMTRPDEIQTWPFRAKNFIMYVPDGDKSQEKPTKPLLQHQNTRFQAPPFDLDKSKETITALAKQQDISVTGKIGVDGESLSADTSLGAVGGEYGLVATPSPRPGAEGPGASPLMTWGEIEGTPFRLDGGDTPLPAVGAGIAYRMLESGARERIALQLAEQAARRRRPTTPRVQPPTPSFRSNTERLASMSPAARRLATKHLMSPRLRLTPLDIRVRTHTGTPKRGNTPRTPLVKSNQKLATPNRSKQANIQANNMTDNLLNINVEKRDRLKAQDFFK